MRPVWGVKDFIEKQELRWKQFYSLSRELFTQNEVRARVYNHYRCRRNVLLTFFFWFG
jgi:hypothetical protein